MTLNIQMMQSVKLMQRLIRFISKGDQYWVLNFINQKGAGMSGAMNFSYMTRICHMMAKTCQAQNKQVNGSAFYDALTGKNTEKIEMGSATEPSHLQGTADMSMEEYKQYIYDKISSLPVHDSNLMDSVSVMISDEGFEAMKNDPAYEQWVLDTLQSNFAQPDAWSSVCGSKFCIFYFGATKEESRVESWRLGFRNGKGQAAFNEKAKESFWERRKKRREEWLEQLEELAEKKALSKRMAQSAYFMKCAAVKPMKGEPQTTVNMDALAMQIFSSFKANILLESFQGKRK